MKTDHHLTPILATMAQESLDMTSIQGKADRNLAIDTEKHKMP